MVTLQVAEVGLSNVGVLLQVAEVGLSNTPFTGTTELQISEVRFGVSGPAPILTLAQDPTESLIVKAGTRVTLTATITGTYTAVIWEIDGMGATLAGTDTVKAFVAPWDPDGGFVAVSVHATGPGGDSATVVLATAVLPHSDWYLVGSQWTPVYSDTDL